MKNVLLFLAAACVSCAPQAAADKDVTAWEKLLGAKSLEKAIEIQTAYAKTAYEGFVAQATRMGELYADLAKEAYKPFEGLVADFQLLIDIREFQLSTASEPVAEVEFSAKILGQDGRILDARIFRAAAPAKAADAPAAAAALNEAFGKAATELVVWVAGVI